MVNSTNHNQIARLNSDGNPDSSFRPTPNATVNAIIPLSSGKLIVAGNFTFLNNTNRNRIARLNGDGTLDTSFDPGTGANGVVNSLALQSDGEILLAGDFTALNSVSRNYIARLNSSGSLDTGFNPGRSLDAVVNSVVRQPDGKLIIAAVLLMSIRRLGIASPASIPMEVWTLALILGAAWTAPTRVFLPSPCSQMARSSSADFSPPSMAAIISA